MTTFGNVFGLALYDKEKRGVRAAPQKHDKKTVRWTILGGPDKDKQEFDDPVAYCTATRAALESIAARKDLTAFWNRNWQTIAELRETLPALKTDNGKHYGDLLEALYCARRQELAAPGTRAIGRPFLEKGPKRVRDPEHLKFVGTQACLVCGRKPSHAHHIRHAQPRAMGKKVSDQWTVPLCNIHHRELHDHGNELAWWEIKGIDPCEVAEHLWQSRHSTPTNINGGVEKPAVTQ